MLIRQITEEDAGDFLALLQQLDRETQFMMLEPDERQTTAEQQRQRIGDALAAENQTILVVEIHERLVGFLNAQGGTYRRNRHSAHIVIGIVQAYTGQGIGTQLFEILDAWARQRGIHRLELTVMAHNAAALGLYRKMGFAIEGTRRHALFVNGAYVDEVYMAKLL